METRQLLLEDIRGDLIRQEETIIFALIERSQYARNKTCYHKNDEKSQSFMEEFLKMTEDMHAKLGRYDSPDENAFFSDSLPKALAERRALVSAHENNSDIQAKKAKISPLVPNKININTKVLALYIHNILDTLCGGSDKEDDGEYGSTCSADIAVLQALSKRIHYGKFVAEAKFQKNKEQFSEMIKNNDANGIMNALTFIAKEDEVVERVRFKASRYGTDTADGEEPIYKVKPEIISELYRDFLIPLNKQVQVEYLLQRLTRPSFAYYNNKLSNKEDSILGECKKRFEGNGMASDSVEQVFLALNRHEVAYGIVPIQDKLGFNKSTQRALMSSPNLLVCGVIFQNNIRYYIISSFIKDLATSNIVAYFSAKNEPGSLVRVLNTLENVNMTALESIPLIDDPFEFQFFVEFEVKLDINQKHIIEHLTQQLISVTDCFRLAGAY